MEGFRQGPGIRRRQAGIVLPLFVISLVVLLGVAGLVFDLGQTYARKSELQNVLDAAALSGAQVLFETGSPDAAQEAALATFNDNLPNGFIGAGTVPVIELSDTYDPFAPGGTEPRYIRVRVEDLGFGVWFAHVLPGVPDQFTVRGSALAGPSPPIDDEFCNIAPMMVCGDPDDPDNFGYPPAGSGVEQVLKTGSNSAGWEVGPGNFQLLSLDCGTGADCVRQGLAGGFSGCASADETVTTEPGNTVGPVAQGLNTRFGIYNGPVGSEDYPPDTVVEYEYDTASDANQFWFSDYEARNAAEDYDYAPPGGAFNRRLLAIVIGDCSSTTEGRGEVDVLGTGCFFLTRPAQQNGQQEVYGEFIESCGADGTITEDPTEDPVTGATLHKIVLYKDPDSHDS